MFLMMAARFSWNMSFVFGVADSVWAYTLIRMTGPVMESRRRVRKRSEPPLPGSTILSKLSLTASLTPCSLGLPERFPYQKNVVGYQSLQVMFLGE